MAPSLVIAGPTGVGKSRLAIEVAEAAGAEIISADSRQVYRDLDIGTAKPSTEDRARVPHHLVDCLDPSASYSAGAFRRDCSRAIADVHARGLPSLIVGGSTLYVEALVRGIADLPEVPEVIVTALTQEATTESGRERLYAELDAADPEAATTLDPTKSQRLVRLVGLLRTTGRPPSALWREAHLPPIPHVLVVLDRPRDDLYARIEQRVEAMLKAGLVAEVHDLYGRGEPVRRLLRATIGYREIVAAIEGEWGLDEAIRLIKRNSRRYAKRQWTWYRRYTDAVWLDARTTSADSVLESVARWPSR